MADEPELVCVARESGCLEKRRDDLFSWDGHSSGRVQLHWVNAPVSKALYNQIRAQLVWPKPVAIEFWRLCKATRDAAPAAKESA